MKTKTLLLIAVSSVLILGAFIFTNALTFSNLESLLLAQLEETQHAKTTNAADQLEAHLNKVEDGLVALSRFPDVEGLSPERCHSGVFIHEPGSVITNLLMADAAGDVVACSSPAVADYAGLNVKNKEYFSEPRDTNQPYVATRGNEFTVSVPLFETTEYTPYPNFRGAFEGVLFTMVSLSELSDRYLQSLASRDGVFLLVDGSTVVLSNGDMTPDDLDVMLSAEDGLFTHQGKSTILTSADLLFGANKWKLLVIFPLDDIKRELSGVQLRHFFSIVFVMVVIGALFFFMVSLHQSKEEADLKLKKTKVSLEKMGIHVGVEEDTFTTSDISLEPGKLYLVKEDDENHAHELFIGTLNRGFAGLGIVRDDPRSVKKRYNLQKTSFIWLTEEEVDGIPKETDIDALFDLIKEFVKKSKKSVILIDRMDYVFNQNKDSEVVKKVHSLKDLAVSNDCVIIMGLNADLIDTKNLKALEADAIDLFGKHLNDKVSLPEMEMKMLEYINERNTQNKMASYKDITTEFKITKPTTRAKIKNLTALGLVTVEQKGRFKSLKITSSGRRVIG